MNRWNVVPSIKMFDFARNRSVLLQSASMLLLLAGGVAGCGDEPLDPQLELADFEPSGPTAVDHLGRDWIVDESGSQILVIDDDQMVDRYELDGLVGIQDIEVTETHVYVLANDGGEPVIAQAGRNDVAPSAWESFPIPADNVDVRDVTGLRKDGDGVVSLQLKFGREYLPLFTADGDLDVAPAPLAGPGSTQVHFDVSGYFPANSDYVPVGPTRLLDTRLPDQQIEGPLINTQVVELTVAGNAGLPQANQIGAVVLNVTAVPSQLVPAGGYLSVLPVLPPQCPAATSNINFAAARNTAGLVIIAPDDGKIHLCHTITNPVPNAATHLVVDVFGYFPPSADIHMVQPARVFDSRNVPYGPKFTANSTRNVQIAGVGGIPLQGVGAVIANVTAANTAGTGTATVYEAGTQKPNTTSLHYIDNNPRANLVIVPVSNDGFASIYTSQSAHYIVDVLGYFGTGDTYEPVPPHPIVKLQGLQDQDLVLFGFPNIPDDAKGIFGHIAAVQPTHYGFLLVYFKHLVPDPKPSNLNFYPGNTVSNAVLSGLGKWGNIRVRTTFP